MQVPGFYVGAEEDDGMIGKGTSALVYTVEFLREVGKLSRKSNSQKIGSPTINQSVERAKILP